MTSRATFNGRGFGAGALLLCATVLSYLPALSGGFIWNDSDYVTAPALRSLKGLALIWIAPGVTQQYYPVLHSVFWLQHRIFGDHPLGYHIVSVLTHAGAAILFALVLGRLFAGARAEAEAGRPAADGSGGVISPSRPRTYEGVAWMAALLFALHPVHVASVAWITEQKNTLSLGFYLGAALCYLRFDETRGRRAYAAASALFVISLGCKTVTATLPAALLVILWWKRGRVGWRRDVGPLLPWLAVGAAAGLFSSLVEQAYVGAQGADFQLPAAGRVLVAGRAVCFYAGKLAWPFDLNFIYPRWNVDPAVWWQWLYPLGVLAVGAALWAVRRRTRGPLAVYLFFVGSLFPVLGFVNLYGARYSWVWDHWQYLADLGVFAGAAAVLSLAWNRATRGHGWSGSVPAALLTLGLGAVTWSHACIYHDDETLFRATLALNPGCWLAHNNLGLVWSRTPGRMADAMAEYQAALRLRPDSAEPHFNLGTAWLEMPGRLDAAIAQFQESLRLNPAYAQAHNNLGLALSKVPGRMDEAIAQYEEAVRLAPYYAGARNNLGNVWLQTPGRLEDAIFQYAAAVRLKPDYAEAHNNLGLALSKAPGRMNEAIAQFEEAVRLQPDLAGAHNNLGLALSRTPARGPEAIAEFEEAVRLQPGFSTAWHNLGVSRYQSGDMPAAAAAFREELRLSPDDTTARQALAATLRHTDDH